MLYLPTSNDIKFKAKAWIDVVGARTAKALGSAINDAVQGNPGPADVAAAVRERAYTFVVSLALFGVALNMGRRYDTIKASGAIVGEEDAAPTGGYELVSTAPRNEGPWRRNLERPTRSTSTTTASSRIRDDAQLCVNHTFLTRARPAPPPRSPLVAKGRRPRRGRSFRAEPRRRACCPTKDDAPARRHQQLRGVPSQERFQRSQVTAVTQINTRAHAFSARVKNSRSG